MTKEQVTDLYNKFLDADYTYHKYIDQFITVVINETVMQEAVRTRLPEDEKVITELDRNVEKARLQYEKAFKLWADKL